MSVFTPDRLSSLESFAFRIEHVVESLATRMQETFDKLLSHQTQQTEALSLVANSSNAIHKRLDIIDSRLDALEQTQKNLQSEMRAIDKKLDQVLALLNQKGV